MSIYTNMWVREAWSKSWWVMDGCCIIFGGPRWIELVGGWVMDELKLLYLLYHHTSDLSRTPTLYVILPSFHNLISSPTD